MGGGLPSQKKDIVAQACAGDKPDVYGYYNNTRTAAGRLAGDVILRKKNVLQLLTLRWESLDSDSSPGSSSASSDSSDSGLGQQVFRCADGSKCCENFLS